MSGEPLVDRDPATLRGYDKNTRTHTTEQLTAIRRSIDRFTFTNPVLLRDNGIDIGAGHARVAAALLAPALKTVPTRIIPGLTDDEWRAYIIADNQLAITGSGWSEDLLRSELLDLRTSGFDISLTGFDSIELSNLFAPRTGETDPDEVPPPPADPVSQLGDLWILGDHRLICGSSTDPSTVERLLNGAQPHLMVTDPPYGVEYDPNWRNSADRSTKIVGRKIGATALGAVQNDDRADWREAWALFPGDVAYVWHAGLNGPVVGQSLIACGFEIRSQIIWNKSAHIIGRGDYHWKHEPCYYAVRKGKAGHFNRADRTQNTVWDISHKRSETGHSTQKPVECMRRPIENNSKPGDAVYEPFSGSGTTIIAAQMTSRRCYAVELNPAYVDLGVQRWMQFTGQEAFHEDGRSWAQVVSARVADEDAVE